jgi:AcrR family transcriptional regulator
VVTHLDEQGHPRARDPHDDTRARVLEVALELFAEQGFAATSTREISDRLGFTKAALYYHFRTKDELLDALLAPAISDLDALVGQAPARPSTSARRQLLAGFVDLVAANAKLIRVLTQDPSVTKDAKRSQRTQMFERFAQLLSGNESPTVAERARVRAALGGVRVALLYADPTDDPAVVREATLAAACGALGIPAPHPARD